MEGLSKEVFTAVCEMIASHLRIRETDRWASGLTMDLKYASFRSEYPEVNDTQFFYAGEQWIQNTPNREQFVRYPTWRELMVTLYRSEGGLANRSWGFREDLPEFAAPTPEQCAMLPGSRPLLPPPDRSNQDAYRTVGQAGEAERRGLRPVPVPDPPRLAPAQGSEEWDRLIAEVEDYDPDRPVDAAEDP